MANLQSALQKGSQRRFTAAEAKNQFGHVLDAAIAGETVAITKYGQVRAILLSVDEYESLSQAPSSRLNLLTQRFDDMLARMQGEEAGRKMRQAFDASPTAMGKAAVRVAQGKRESRALG